MMDTADRLGIGIEPLATRHDRASFACDIPALDDYLRRQAGQDVKKAAAATFVLAARDSKAILGFYTLAATSVDLDEFPEEIARKLPRYPRVPAILLGRLAVDRRRRGRGFGELLLMNAVERCLGIKDIGWAAVVVDAKDIAAAAFYEHYHFIHYGAQSNLLFIPRKTIFEMIG